MSGRPSPAHREERVLGGERRKFNTHAKESQGKVIREGETLRGQAMVSGGRSDRDSETKTVGETE